MSVSDEWAGSVAAQAAGLQVIDKASVQVFQLRHCQAVSAGGTAGVAEQVVDLGAPAMADILVHGRIVGRGGQDHSLYFLVQVAGRFGLAATMQQVDQFVAQRVDFGQVPEQAAILAVVQYRQWVDRTVERQFAPQASRDCLLYTSPSPRD